MKRTMLLAASGMVLSLAVFSTTHSQTTTGTLTGTVTDEKGAPLNRATVKIQDGPGGFTDVHGKYLVAGIRVGNPTVVVRYAGKEDYRTTVRISLDQTTTLNVKMVPKGGTCIIVASRTGSGNNAEQVGTVAVIQGEEIAPSARTHNVYLSVPRTTVRGGRGEGTSHGSEGGETTDPFTGGTGDVGMNTYPTISTLAVQEVQVVNSGFGAEYKEVICGVVPAPPPIFGHVPTEAPPVVATAQYNPIYENEFIQTSFDRTSTFSIDVDAASYSLARRTILSGQRPHPDAVRIEEMVNYFPYNYPQPEGNHPFSISTEISDCPWNREHRLIRIGLQGRSIPESELPAANLVFLIDVSGSMQSNDKLPLLKSSLAKLIAQLRGQDHVTIVVYAGNAGLVLPATSGSDRATILAALDGLNAGGSTAGGAGIKLAYDVARQNFKEGGNNRVILATDGDFNLGVSGEKELVELIEEERKSGVFLTVLGFGTGNYQDVKMEQLADHGNGAYAYIDDILEGEKVLVHEISGTLTTIARDVKIQIVFNPEQVESYRLVGYENRMLRTEDFDDDRKDAGEIGAGMSVTAIYEVVPGSRSLTRNARRNDTLDFPEVSWNPEEMMRARLRYKLPSEEASNLIEESVNGRGPRIEVASDDYRFAVAVAEFGLLLRNSRFKGDASTEGILRLAEGARGDDPHGYRGEFIEIVKEYRNLSR